MTRLGYSATASGSSSVGRASGIELGSQGHSGGRVFESDPEQPSSKPKSSRRQHFAKGGRLQPFRLLHIDLRNLTNRYASDWAVFNQQVLASAVYIFFTNILPGITFASDLYVLTGKSWGTIEVVFSTGLCGLAFALYGNPSISFCFRPQKKKLRVLTLMQVQRAAAVYTGCHGPILGPCREYI